MVQPVGWASYPFPQVRRDRVADVEGTSQQLQWSRNLQVTKEFTGHRIQVVTACRRQSAVWGK